MTNYEAQKLHKGDLVKIICEDDPYLINGKIGRVSRGFSNVTKDVYVMIDKKEMVFLPEEIEKQD